MTLKESGRLIGAMFLLQFVMGVVNMQVLTAPLFLDGGYLANAAEHVLRLGVAVLLGLAGCLLSLAIAAVAYPVLKVFSEPVALGFALLCVLGASLAALEQAGILGMREFSLAYARAGADAGELFETLRAAGSIARNAAHYLGLLVFGATMGLWYLGLLIFSLVPRAIAVFGLCAVALQLYSISLPVLGGEVSFLLLAPMGLAQLIQSLWLLVLGFRERS